MVSLTFASLGAAVAALAALHGTADALDKTLYGLNYDLRQGPDWDPNKCKSATTIASDLKVLSSITKRVRTYALTDCDVRPVLTTAKSLGLTVWLGVWVSGDSKVFDNEVATAQKLFDEGLIDSNVVGFNVGSEAVYRGDITAEEAVNYITQFKKFLKTNSLTTPVAVTDIIDTMIAHPEIVEAGDIVTINQFPFWEKQKADKAVAQFNKRIQPLLKLAGPKEVIITETGWSTGGENANASDATAAGAARYLNDFYVLATEQNWKYYYFQGFDSEYKAKLPGESNTVEAYFGIFDSTGAMKPGYKDLKITKLSSSSDASGSSGGSGTSSSGTGGANESGSGKSGSKSKSDGTSATTTDESGPGTVSAGSANSVDSTTPSSGAKNSTKKNSTTPSPSKSAASSVLATGVSVGIVLVSMVLASL